MIPRQLVAAVTLFGLSLATICAPALGRSALIVKARMRVLRRPLLRVGSLNDARLALPAFPRREVQVTKDTEGSVVIFF